MAITSSIKRLLNRWFATANLRVDSLTAEKRESARLQALADAGHFQSAFFRPLEYDRAFVREVLDTIPVYADAFASFEDPAANGVGYSFDNAYFSSPDAEVYYTIIRKLLPSRIVEVGSGNSTRIARQAIRDAQAHTFLTCIDPEPRVGITKLADLHVPYPLERSMGAIGDLKAGDILFVDSSHEIKAGNDVLNLFFKVFPALASGVYVHFHDVFLPFDYPAEWVIDNHWEWNEQYLLQASLEFSGRFEVLWPGYFLQRTSATFSAHFPNAEGRRAQSYWLRVAPPTRDPFNR